jgi:tRNA A37 methylthiotransferase MiaB
VIDLVVLCHSAYARKNVSQTIEKLVKESEGLAKNGVKELILIAQDLTYYGLDIYKKRALRITRSTCTSRRN